MGQITEENLQWVSLLCGLRDSMSDFRLPMHTLLHCLEIGVWTRVESAVNIFVVVMLRFHAVTAVFRSLVFGIILSFSFPPPFLFPSSIAQVPRMTSVWPRTPFRPLFSAVQTASLLSSHPFEAAMFGVAGAVYYLCVSALTSRWNPSKVGLSPPDSDTSTLALCDN